MTRWDEGTGVSNLGRADYAHQVGADYFIRVHLNMAEKKTANAIDIYCPDNSPYAGLVVDKATYRLLARALADALSVKTGVKTARTHFTDRFIGSNWSQMPTFLVETGYMSSPANDILLSHPAYQDRVARGIAAGVIAMEEVLRGIGVTP
jgi:N-acetylmuramoyl-L-alanine amidase